MSDENLGAPRTKSQEDNAKPAESGANTALAERRTHSRYAVSASAELLDPSTQTRITGRTNDLSLGGCYMDTGNALAVGTAVRLRLSAGRWLFDTSARVVSAHPGMGMGLEFVDTTPEQARLLQKWIAELSGQPSVESAEVEFTAVEAAQTAAPNKVREVVDELIALLRRKGTLEESEARTLHKKLSE